MPLGPSFRHTDDISKAIRKVRTLAGVRFFQAPIGTPITPGMVKAAREKHGDKKTDNMLTLQRRNSARDNRRAFFQNQAGVRGRKREERLEQNSMRRADRDDRKGKVHVAEYKAPVAPPVAKPADAPAAPESPKARATNTMADEAIDLIQASGKWNEKQLKRAIEIVMAMRGVAGAEQRALVAALRERMLKEE